MMHLFRIFVYSYASQHLKVHTCSLAAWIFNCIFKISKNSFMKSVDEKIIFINMYDLCKNYMMH